MVDIELKTLKGIGIAAGLILVIMAGISLSHWHGGIGIDLRNISIGGNGSASTIDANLSKAIDLENKANASLRNATRDGYYATLGMNNGGAGNPESAKLALKGTTEALKYIDAANAAARSAQGVKGVDKVYASLANDSRWMISINEAVSAVGKPKYADLGQKYHESAQPQVNQPSVDNSTPQVNNQQGGNNQGPKPTPTGKNSRADGKKKLRGGVI